MKKKKLMPLPSLKDAAWTRLSIFIRLSAADKNGIVKCFTCDSPHIWKDLHGGHFFHGHYRATFLMPENVKPQCVACNRHKNGNLAVYALRLLKIHGPQMLLDLEALSQKEFKPTRAYYEKIIAGYKEKARPFLVKKEKEKK